MTADLFPPRALALGYLARAVRILASLPYDAEHHDPAHDLLADMMEACEADEPEDLALALEDGGF